MTHEFKDGDRVRLVGVVVGKVIDVTILRLDGCASCEGYGIAPEAMAHATLITKATHTEPCKGTNCGCMNGVDHSPECEAEHAAAIAGGKFVKPELPTLKYGQRVHVKNRPNMRFFYCRTRADGMVDVTNESGLPYAFEAGELVATIPPAQEPKAPLPLDTSKPIRIKGDSQEIRYIGIRSDGRVVYETKNLMLWASNPDALENIPTPKRTASRDMVMVDDGMGTPPYILYDNMEFEEISFVGKIIARGTTTLSEGMGMEEAQS